MAEQRDGGGRARLVIIEDGRYMDGELGRLAAHVRPAVPGAEPFLVDHYIHEQATDPDVDLVTATDTIFLDALDAVGRSRDHQRSLLASLDVLDRLRLQRSAGARLPKVIVYSMEIGDPRVEVPLVDFDDVVAARFHAGDLLDRDAFLRVLGATRPEGRSRPAPEAWRQLGVPPDAHVGEAHQVMRRRPDAWDLVVGPYPWPLTPKEATRRWIRRHVCPPLGVVKYAEAARVVRLVALQAPFDR